MGETTERCAVCDQPGTGAAQGRTTAAAGRAPEPRPVLRAGLSRVIIEGRMLLLCRAHAATVVAAMPETFDDLRALFTGAVPELGARPAGALAPAGAALLLIERRSPISRRSADDRRVFPPRLEGRRLGAGRRATDPCD
jgi:hypothetical protein